MILKDMSKTNINKFNEIYSYCIRKGFPKLTSRIFANRLLDYEDFTEFIECNNNQKTDKYKLKDLELGAKLVKESIDNNEHILLLTDYDMDGQTSAFVLYESLTKIIKYNVKKVSVIINKRKNGNGVTEKLLSEVLDLHNSKPIDLIITADHSSSDEDRIRKIKELGIKTVLTDHHLLPESGVPKSATAFINPQQPNCEYDKTISGCGVAFLLMDAVEDLVDLEKDNEYKKIKNFIRFIMGASILGDSMNMCNINNRLFVKEAFEIANDIDRHFILDLLISKSGKEIVAEDFIGFNLAPLINSASRMDRTEASFNFLTSKDIDEAKERLRILNDINKRRKKRTEKIVEESDNQYLGDLTHKHSCVTYVPDSLGINGIVSSNLGNKYGKPAVTFTDTDNPEVIAGSGRAMIDDFNIRKAYENISKDTKDIVLGFGGHKGAAGCSIKKDKLMDFKDLFDLEVINQIGDSELNKVFSIDSAVTISDINYDLIDQIELAGPYGLGYEYPRLITKLKVKHFFTIGSKREHIKIRFYGIDGNYIDGIFLSGNSSGFWDRKKPDSLYIVFEPRRSKNRVTNENILELFILGMRE